MASINNRSYTNMLLDEDEFSEQILPDNLTPETFEQSQVEEENKNTTTKGGRSQNFSNDEDFQLICAYLNVSTDPIIGNQQKLDAFWMRVHEYFLRDVNYDRTQGSLSSRWNSINRDVSKFVGCYDQVQQQQQSGLTEQDRILKARALFKTTTNKNFQLLHCWNVLKNEVRWKPSFSHRSNKSSKKHIGSSPASSSPATPNTVNLGDDNTETGGFERPMGRKAAKEKLKKKKDKEHVPDLDAATILESWKNEYADNELSKRERSDKQICIQQEYIEIENKKRNDMIMMTDTSGMDETRATYFKQLQEKILSKN